MKWQLPRLWKSNRKPTFSIERSLDSGWFSARSQYFPVSFVLLWKSRNGRPTGMPYNWGPFHAAKHKPHNVIIFKFFHPTQTSHNFTSFFNQKFTISWVLKVSTTYFPFKLQHTERGRLSSSSDGKVTKNPSVVPYLKSVHNKLTYFDIRLKEGFKKTRTKNLKQNDEE